MLVDHTLLRDTTDSGTDLYSEFLQLYFISVKQLSEITIISSHRIEVWTPYAGNTTENRKYYLYTYEKNLRYFEFCCENSFKMDVPVLHYGYKRVPGRLHGLQNIPWYCWSLDVT